MLSKRFLYSLWRIPLLSGILAVGCQKDISRTAATAAGTVSEDATAAYTIIKYSVPPQHLDPNTTTALSNHTVFYNTDPNRKNVLYVFLPGTYRNPEVCQATQLKAASMGYHAIGLMYDNLVPGNPLCKATGDTTCHVRARLEVIDGTDRSTGVNVNVANSLINRLYKLIKYMSNAQPTQGWAQYLTGTQINWSKIIIAGHSQGGAVAGVIGKYYPVKRVIMFSMIDFLNNGKIPNWENNWNGREKYFALINPSDEQVPYSFVTPGWLALGMASYGTPTNIASVAFPYNNSHTLITTAVPNTTMTDKFHNSTGVDAYIPKDASGKYIFDKAWEYLIDYTPPVTPPGNQLPIANAGSDVSIALSWHFDPLLDGNGSKDPDGYIVSSLWTRESGPTTFSFANATLRQTRVTFTGAGTYVFRLTVTDNKGASSGDLVTVTVKP